MGSVAGPGLLINLQGFTIDYDAVAYRTGVILTEDPGQALSGDTSWEVAPYLEEFNKDNVLRFGLAAVSRRSEYSFPGKSEPVLRYCYI